MLNNEEIKANGKINLLLISDDLTHESGVARMARYVVKNSLKKYNWFQIAANQNIQDSKEMFDITPIFTDDNNSSVKILKKNGFGDVNLVNQFINTFDIKAIILFTDPKRFVWLFNDEFNIRKRVPIVYINIWDNLPYPQYNRAFYQSCNGILNISKQTNLIVKNLLGEGNYIEGDYDKTEIEYIDTTNKVVAIDYFPHAVDENVFYEIKDNMDEKILANYRAFEKSVLMKNTDKRCIFFFNGRNTHRKHIIDLITAYKNLLDSLTSQRKRDELLLIVKSDIVNFQDGSDIYRLYLDLVKNGNITFINNILSEEQINYLYNIAHFTVMPSSCEGFGIPFLESIYTHTPVIATVTGGLQDQMNFKDFVPTIDYPSNAPMKYTECAGWCIPLKPIMTMNGSVPTPYIYDNVVPIDTLTEALKKAYDSKLNGEYFKTYYNAAKEGRKWMLSSQSKMNLINMTETFDKMMDFVLATFKPKLRYRVYNLLDKINSYVLTNTGVWNSIMDKWI